jgi:hypothetical protein
MVRVGLVCLLSAWNGTQNGVVGNDHSEFPITGFSLLLRRPNAANAAVAEKEVLMRKGGRK